MTLQLAGLPARVDYVEGVYQSLVDAITDGTLAPGQRITQDEIAQQLNVSRSPVLQALRMLKKDGLVQDAPGRGVQVTPLEPDWVAKLYEVRGALDLLATRLAIESAARIDLALIETGRQASRRGDLNAIIDADMAFHHAIYTASGNELIAESASRYWMHLRRVMGARHQRDRETADIWNEHQAMAEAINQGDLGAALAHTEQHIQRARRELVQQLRGAVTAPTGRKTA